MDSAKEKTPKSYSLRVNPPTIIVLGIIHGRRRASGIGSFRRVK